MSNLKPCPFCGGEAELCYGPGLGTDSCRGYTLQASCNECCAKSPGLWQEKKPEPDDAIWKDAADEWNYRPGEIDATKCGVAYCEHHREGLPVCVECREESTLAHDKVCALLVEARAEIERKDKLIEQLKLALKTLRKYPHTYKMTQGSIVVDKDIEQCNAALLAAERSECL